MYLLNYSSSNSIFINNRGNIQIMKKVFLFVSALGVTQLCSFTQGVQPGLKPGFDASSTIVSLNYNAGTAGIVDKVLVGIPESPTGDKPVAHNQSLTGTRTHSSSPAGPVSIAVSIKPLPEKKASLLSLPSAVVGICSGSGWRKRIAELGYHYRNH